MSIGIMDDDFSSYTLVPFNLEAMKLSAYYKKQREIVVLSKQFEPDNFSKFFYRKDYNNGEFPSGLFGYDNLSYGGLAFSNNIYVPMNKEIELMHPDSSLYKRVEEDIMATGTAERKKIYQNLMEAEHCRLSLDGRNIWSDYNSQFYFLRNCRNLIIHDYDLGKIKGSYSEVKDILSRARIDGWATRVGMKFPVRIYNGQDLLDWSSLRVNSTFYSLRYIGFIDWDTFYNWIGRTKEKAVYSQMEYMPATDEAPYSQYEFLVDILPQIYEQIIILRSCRLYFPLIYEDGYFDDPMWEKVLYLINLFAKAMFKLPEAKFFQWFGSHNTMMNFVEHMDKIGTYIRREKFLTESEVKDILNFVGQNNPKLYKMFKETCFETLGGRLYDAVTRNQNAN